MKFTFVPDYIFGTFDKITVDFLLENNIKAVILDIDNTLVPYEIAEPTDEVRAWLNALTEAGIKVAFVSNNHAPRVEKFNESLGFPAFPDSGKPFKKACRAAMEAMGSTPETTAIIGDQVFTDVLAGRNAGLAAAFLVGIVVATGFAVCGVATAAVFFDGRGTNHHYVVFVTTAKPFTVGPSVFLVPCRGAVPCRTDCYARIEGRNPLVVAVHHAVRVFEQRVVVLIAVDVRVLGRHERFQGVVQVAGRNA